MTQGKLTRNDELPRPRHSPLAKGNYPTQLETRTQRPSLEQIEPTSDETNLKTRQTLERSGHEDHKNPIKPFMDILTTFDHFLIQIDLYGHRSM